MDGSQRTRQICKPTVNITFSQGSSRLGEIMDESSKGMSLNSIEAMPPRKVGLSRDIQAMKRKISKAAC